MVEGLTTRPRMDLSQLYSIPETELSEVSIDDGHFQAQIEVIDEPEQNVRVIELIGKQGKGVAL
jgi:hypothetical protein